MNNTTILAFGRLNPPTAGHAKLIQFLLQQAKKYSGTVTLFLSKSQDKVKNPLSYAEKTSLIKTAFPNINLGPNTVNTPYDALTWASEHGYNHIVLAVGSDRVGDFTSMAKTWNSKNTNKVTITVSSIPRFESISATTARKLAIQSNFSEFKKISMPNIPDSKLRQTMDTIKQRFHESVEPEFDILFEATDEDDDDKDKKDKSKDKSKFDIAAEITDLKDLLATLEDAMNDEEDEDLEDDDEESENDETDDSEETDDDSDESDIEINDVDDSEDKNSEDTDTESTPKKEPKDTDKTDKGEDSSKSPIPPSKDTNKEVDKDEDESDDEIDIDEPNESEDSENTESDSSPEPDTEQDEDSDESEIELDGPEDEDGEFGEDEEIADPADRVESDVPENQSKLALHPPQKLLFTMGQKYQDQERRENAK